MSTGRGSPVSCSSVEASKSKQGPEHLIVLVHGIMASPSDWTYGEAVLKKRLGDNFFIYASSSNIYAKSFDGINVAGRRLAKEQAKETGSGAGVMLTSGGSEISRTSGLGAIAGLEPTNFITLATPHLGVRGKNQGIFLFSCFPEPRMPDMVGWKTSSIRRELDLRKPLRRSVDGYKYIVNVEYCSPVSSDGPHFPLRAARAKEAAQSTPNMENTQEYHQMMEEEMIRGLQRVGWKKVDVNFHASMWPYSAHNNMHVKNEWLHNAGAGVIAHVADSLKQTCLPSSLSTRN
ncbi:hypothetical protein TRIUR3_12538 [Triticum urartu]|uniref:DUF676 domain-containing protein n=1 Tax=Triticum urartu TaxID=4572 RepID=M7YZK2_TRIUA|nr:hypothetical protein TRIUR3_12538 [Triticum urartu]